MAEPLTVQDYMRAERELTLEETAKGFRIHAALYVVCNIAFIALNLITEPEFLWFFFPLLGWGFGLATHYIFGVRLAGQEITERQARIEQRAHHGE